MSRMASQRFDDTLPPMESDIEALADAWASIDGKLDKFRRGKTAKNIMAYGGHYAGYLADAEEMIERLARRGYVLRKSANPKEGA